MTVTCESLNPREFSRFFLEISLLDLESFWFRFHFSILSHFDFTFTSWSWVTLFNFHFLKRVKLIWFHFSVNKERDFFTFTSGKEWHLDFTFQFSGEMKLIFLLTFHFSMLQYPLPDQNLLAYDHFLFWYCGWSQRCIKSSSSLQDMGLWGGWRQVRITD